LMAPSFFRVQKTAASRFFAGTFGMRMSRTSTSAADIMAHVSVLFAPLQKGTTADFKNVLNSSDPFSISAGMGVLLYSKIFHLCADPAALTRFKFLNPMSMPTVID